MTILDGVWLRFQCHTQQNNYDVMCVLPGPTLLFEKVCKGGEKGRRFYACSACRDRKDCKFFQWDDEKVGSQELLVNQSIVNVIVTPMIKESDT